MVILDYAAQISPSVAVDYAAGPIPTAALLAAGVSDVCRYLAPLGRGDWKRITSAEYRDLLAAGIRVTLVWENFATDWLGGAPAGREHGLEAARQATDLRYPPGATIVGSCDVDLSAADWPASRDYVVAFAATLRTAGYRPGVYGPWDALQRCADAGLVDVFWQAGMSRSWSQGRNAHDHPRAHLIQRAQLRIAGTPVDRSDIIVPAWGQASTTGAVMTYAPDDLLVVRRYVQARTGLDANSVGISGDPAHASSGGYHEGNDDLNRVGQLASDYSKRESGRDRPGTNAASALDIGDFNRGGKTLRQLSLACVAALNRGDQRLADVREVIYTPDGSTVRRWDRLGVRNTGDSSHLFHTHFSFFRDSEGRRAQAGNFLGWLTEFFDGVPQTQGVAMGQQMLVSPSDSTDVYLADGMTRRKVDPAQLPALGNGQTHQAGLLGPLGNNGNVFETGPAATLDAWGVDIEARITAAVAAQVAVFAAADQARDTALAAAITALATGGTSIDTTAVIAAVNTAVDGLRHRLATAATAGAGSLDA